MRTLSILIAAGAVLSLSSIFTSTEAATELPSLVAINLVTAQLPPNTGLQ